MTDEAERQLRPKNADTRATLCVRCRRRVARHQEDGIRLCCGEALGIKYETARSYVNRPWGLEDRDRPSGRQGLEDRLRQLVLAIRQGRARQQVRQDLVCQPRPADLAVPRLQVALVGRLHRVRQLGLAGRRVLAGLVRPEDLLDQRVR